MRSLQMQYLNVTLLCEAGKKKNYKISFSHRNKGFSSSEIPFLLNGVKFTPKVRCPRTLGEKKKVLVQ